MTELIPLDDLPAHMRKAAEDVAAIGAAIRCPSLSLRLSQQHPGRSFQPIRTRCARTSTPSRRC